MLIAHCLNGKQSEEIEVFTTRPDTLMGCTFIAVAPEHPIVQKITPPQIKSQVEDFVKEALRLNFIARGEPEKAVKGSYCV